ncbi:MAG: tRNA pseudouridine synthase A [Bacteroidota bacterium]
MQTIKLKINDSIYNELMWFLNRFSKDEVEIIKENEDFTETKNYLERELEDIKSVTATFFTVEEAEIRIEKTIRKYENPS